MTHTHYILLRFRCLDGEEGSRTGTQKFSELCLNSLMIIKSKEADLIDFDQTLLLHHISKCGRILPNHFSGSEAVNSEIGDLFLSLESRELEAFGSQSTG